MDTDLFRTYQTEFIDYSNNITRDIQSLKTLNGSARDRLKSKIQRNIEKANGSINHMELEANSLVNPATKEQLKQQTKSYKNDIKQMKKDFEASDKEYLFGNEKRRQGDYDDEELEDMRDNSRFKQRMDQNSRMLDQGSETTDAINRIAIEIEEGASETANVLSQQSDQIRSTRNKIADTNSDLRTSSSIIGRMSRRQIIQKVALVGIILVLLIVIAVILFFLLRPYLQPAK
ncbi:vesicle transport v-SNARE [Acrasis kona]|uniref:Vesicle transport v-SNARE n=1 Tax=Acrasis kona TaxID=1008807 RepID=A0AAW2ZQJ4_9EUKA